MKMTLKVTSYQRLSPDQESSYVVSNKTVSIGRAESCDWYLPDPERVLSSKHCVIHFREGSYLITDTSANGVYINDSPQRLGRGQTVEIHHGDVVALGHYRIEVQISRDMSVSENVSAQQHLAHLVNQPQSQPSSSVDSFIKPPPAAQQQGVNPLKADPVPDSKVNDSESISRHLIPAPHQHEPPEHTVDDHLAAEKEFFKPPEPVAKAPPPLIPDDWDPITGNTAPEGQSGTSAVPPEAVPPVQQTQLPNQQPPEPYVPPAAQPLQPKAPEQHGETAYSSGQMTGQPPQIPPAVNPVPQNPVAAEPPPKVPAPQAVVGSASDSELLSAFLKGVGIDPSLMSQTDTLAVMQELGQAFAVMAEGIMQILAARTKFKGEFRLSQTLIKPKNNNPLKFSPNVAEAIQQMLSGDGSVYMGMADAFQQSVDDIQEHQLAQLAGMQSSMMHLLQRLDPATIEKQVGQGKKLSHLTGNRKAQYWDLFNLLYRDLSSTANDDFMKLFGKEFIDVYEEQIRQIRSTHDHGKTE